MPSHPAAVPCFKTVWVVYSTTVLCIAFGLCLYFASQLQQWLMQHPLLMLLVLSKAILKRLTALNLAVLLKVVLSLLLHASKLLGVKLLNTLGIRYGLFFGTKKWRRIRAIKLTLARLFKRYRRRTIHLWRSLNRRQRWVVGLANAPFIAVFWLISTSFNLSGKTMVQRGQEATLRKPLLAPITNPLKRLDQAIVRKILTLSHSSASARSPQTDNSNGHAVHAPCADDDHSKHDQKTVPTKGNAP